MLHLVHESETAAPRIQIRMRRGAETQCCIWCTNRETAAPRIQIRMRRGAETQCCIWCTKAKPLRREYRFASVNEAFSPHLFTLREKFKSKNNTGP